MSYLQQILVWGYDNIPYVKYVSHWGPTRITESFSQETGHSVRQGMTRQGQQATSIV